MATAERIPERVNVPPGIAFQSAGPHSWEDAYRYVSPRDLPVAIEVSQKPSAREIQFSMGFRGDADNGSPGTFEPEMAESFSSEIGGKKIEVAFAISLRRVAWVLVHGIDRVEDLTPDLIRRSLDSLVKNPPKPLSLSAIATLTMLAAMVPTILAHHQSVAASNKHRETPR